MLEWAIAGHRWVGFGRNGAAFEMGGRAWVRVKSGAFSKGGQETEGPGTLLFSPITEIATCCVR